MSGCFKQYIQYRIATDRVEDCCGRGKDESQLRSPLCDIPENSDCCVRHTDLKTLFNPKGNSIQGLCCGCFVCLFFALFYFVKYSQITVRHLGTQQLLNTLFLERILRRQVKRHSKIWFEGVHYNGRMDFHSYGFLKLGVLVPFKEILT